ncbi:hypothetical protein EG68_04158 [Paragonimus skrjabini miyazakii]|uniref:Uncharacterized protein n=1 Tax=Paragonimus skrjabini miyazakii TaxID=59628 RepID=A0A8S9YS09_9TREM|nr:hypothetical protein EG68_04158 [Paragonimus skrjabini miyazakii]
MGIQSNLLKFTGGYLSITIRIEEVGSIKLLHTGDHNIAGVSRMLKSAIDRTYPAAEFRLLLSTRRIILYCSDRSPSENSVSPVIYQFACSCGDLYIRRTDRNLQQRKMEHIPKWLVQTMTRHRSAYQYRNRNPASSIVIHLNVRSRSWFRHFLLRNRKSEILAFFEALLIQPFLGKRC